LTTSAIGDDTASDQATATRAARLSHDLGQLASDEFEGRGVGTKGIDRAAEYIADRFDELGLQTSLFDGVPYQPFMIEAGQTVGPANENHLIITGPDGAADRLVLEQSFRPLSLGGGGEAQGGLVFAGYGISAEDPPYDEFAGLDLKGKIVIVLRKEPQQQREDSPFAGTQPSPHAFFTSKLGAVLSRGAAGMLIVNDQLSAQQQTQNGWQRGADEFAAIATLAAEWQAAQQHAASPDATVPDGLRDQLRLRLQALQQLEDTLAASTSDLLGVNDAGRAPRMLKLPCAAISRATADRLVKSAGGRPLADLEQAIDAELRPQSLELMGYSADLKFSLDRQQLPAKNVMAELPGRGSLADETIIVGAHYDHVGMGGEGSLAPGTIAVHNGADDNGSGTVALLEIARACVEQAAAEDPAKPRRRLLFIAFSGEERGLLGSAHYVREPRFPLANTAAMVNLDMVGRLTDNNLTVYGTGTAAILDRLVEEAAAKQALRLTKEPTGNGPSDHQSFYQAGLPVLHFFTGLHNDYHRPSDDFDKINLAGLVRITDMVHQVVEVLASAPERPTLVKVEDSSTQPPRAVLGIQLDADAPGPGVRIASVAADSGAAAAGLAEGDVIRRIGDHEVLNLGDLRRLMADKSPGDRLKLTTERQGATTTVDVVLQAP
jgi:acetylornithine deacetylase/succinyl-diaminopimelate desuccinylase-like protein